MVLKSSIRSSASPHSVAVKLAFWNSDHVVLKSSICSSDWASRTLNMMKLGSGTGRDGTDDDGHRLKDGPT